jgi:hypothetical protein
MDYDGAPSFFKKKFQRGFFRFFIPSVNSKKIFCKKICQIFGVEKLNQKILVGCQWLQLLFLGANFCPLAVFPKKTNSVKYSLTNCQKFVKMNILENSHIVQASNQGIKRF